MPYSRNNQEEMILRDHLAVDRTILANERTILAYLRTALMLFVTGITLIKLFVDDRLLFITGFFLLPISLIVVLLGIWRFLKTRGKLKIVYKPQ